MKNLALNSFPSKLPTKIYLYLVKRSHILPLYTSKGRAGGGWEDSSSEDDDDLAEFRDLLGSGQGGEVDVAEEAEEALFDGPGGHVSGSEEFEAIRKVSKERIIVSSRQRLILEYTRIIFFLCMFYVL